MYAIGEISRLVDIKVPTIRYYEQAGMIPPPARSPGKQRRYGETDLQRLVFIKHARQLGFTLDAIKSLIELSERSDGDCEPINTLARSHLSAVREKLELLQTLETELKRITTGCESGEIDKCYVIESLANHELCRHEHG